MIRKLCLITFLMIGISVWANIANNTDHYSNININSLITNSPVLSEFRIDESNRDRVYFNSSEPIVATSTTGFIISTKSISSLHINSGQTEGHYFTVSSPFTFWDNSTIRYVGGSDMKDEAGNSLKKFNLTYIDNNLEEPSSERNYYYVTTSGSDSNSGTSESESFRTIKRALEVATAGSTVWVKAGVYRTSSVTYFRHSGTANSPIKLVGYKDSIGDINSMYYNYTEGQVAPDLDPNEMPLMEGNGNFSGLYSIEENYIIIRNFQVTGYYNGIANTRSIGFMVDNCIAKEMYGNGSVEGTGFSLGGGKRDSSPYTPAYNRITNSISMNCGMENIVVRGSNALVENVKTYNDKDGAGGDLGSDYYISIYGDNSIVRNSRAVAISNSVNIQSHGIGVKATEHTYPDWGSTSSYNLIEKCYVKTGSQEGIYSRNVRADYNVFKDIEVEGFGNTDVDGVGVSNQTGAQNNTYERIYFHNLYTAFLFQSGTESGSNPANLHTNNNIIKNSKVENVTYLIQTYNSLNVVATFENNKIYNCTFNNVEYLNRGSKFSSTYYSFSNNEFVNCIFNNVDSMDWGTRRPILQEMFKIDNSNFFGGVSVPTWATNTISLNPNLDSELNITISTPEEIYDGGKDIDVINFDMNGNEREEGKFSIGAYDNAIQSIGSVSPDSSICNGESITLVASGGTTYLWNNGETTSSITVSPDITTIYSVTITDENDISDSHEVEITVDSAPSVVASEDINICSGEEVTLTASGEGNFTWSNGETGSSITVTPLETTTYTVIASNSCATDATDEVIVTVSPSINLSVSDDVIICNGDEVILTAISDEPVTWDNGSTENSITVNPTITTTYTVTSSNANCSEERSVTVIVNDAASVVASEDVSTCSGETVTLTAIGEGDFTWSTGETGQSIVVSPLETTTYTVTASNSCVVTATDEVIVTVSPMIDLSVSDNKSICVGESVTLTATSNESVLWNNGSNDSSITVSPTSTTTYTVVSSNANCSEERSVTVTVNDAARVVASEDVSICSGETVVLTATGEGDFTWSTGETGSSIAVSPSETTSYTVTANNSCSTEATDEVVVIVSPSINLSVSDDIIICNGETVTLTAASNESVLWNNGSTEDSITVSPTSTTTYTVTSSNANCAEARSVTVTVNDAASVVASDDVSICSGETVTLTATGEGNFTWSTGETGSRIQVSPSETTTYSVSSSNSCSSGVTDEVIVTVSPSINLSISDNVSICAGESVTLTATSNESVLWSNGSNDPSITVNPTSTTTYTVVSSNANCSEERSVTVTVNEVASVVASEDISICLGETVTLTATGEGNFTWSTGESGASIQVSPTSTTTYTVSSSNSCSSNIEDTVTVTVNKLPTLVTGSDIVIERGDQVTLTAEGNGTLLWNTGDTTSNITVRPTSTQRYTVSLTNENGCSVEETITVIVNEPIVESNLIAASIGEDITVCKGQEVILRAYGGDRYEWDNNQVEQDIYVKPEESTVYSVRIYNGDEFTLEYIVVYIDDNCDVRENVKAFNVYPNPTYGNFNVDFEGFKDKIHVSVYDINGAKVYSKIITINNGENRILHSIDLSKFAKGIYLLQLFNQGKTDTKKVIHL